MKIDAFSKYKYVKFQNGKASGSKAFVDFLMDENTTIIDKGLRNAFDSFDKFYSFGSSFIR